MSTKRKSITKLRRQSTRAVKNSNVAVEPLDKRDFKQLKDFHLLHRNLYEDTEFPDKENRSNFEWKRPDELVAKPVFFSDQVEAKQYTKDHNWGGIVAAMTNLKLNTSLYRNVVPEDQSFSEKYAGIFHFKFWKCGEWTEIIIDDRLPMKKDQIAFFRTENDDEFGTELLIKAYAKYYGSYNALKGIAVTDAMEDFTGGISEIIDLKAKTNEKDLFDYVLKSNERGSMMACSFKKRRFYSKKYQKCPDLVPDHNYSITGVKVVDIEILTFKMIKLRSQFRQISWDGPWSKESPENKNFISTFTAPNGMGQPHDHINEFWLTFEYFQLVFDSLDICHLNSEDTDKKWHLNQFDGKWIPGISAGGALDRLELDRFKINPQYMIVFEQPASVLISVMQKYECPELLEELNIGFTMFKITQYEIYKDSNSSTTEFFEHKKPIFEPIFTDLREISLHLNLDPGGYLIIPSTEKPLKHGEFLLRVFSSAPNFLTEHYNTALNDDDEDDDFYDAVEDVNVSATEFKDILQQIIVKNEDTTSQLNLDTAASIRKSRIQLRKRAPSFLKTRISRNIVLPMPEPKEDIKNELRPLSNGVPTILVVSEKTIQESLENKDTEPTPIHQIETLLSAKILNDIEMSQISNQTPPEKKIPEKETITKQESAGPSAETFSSIIDLLKSQKDDDDDDDDDDENEEPQSRSKCVAIFCGLFLGMGVAFAVCPGCAPEIMNRARQFMKKEPKPKPEIAKKKVENLSNAFVEYSKFSDKPGYIKLSDLTKVMYYGGGFIPSEKEAKKLEKKAKKEKEMSFEDFTKYIFEYVGGLFD